jgi:serine/threonine protein phosphatase PrpC
VRPPILGRPSPASLRAGGLRPAADASSAAYRADGGDGVGWSVRAASVAGARHRLGGHGPEDAYAWRILEPGDGAEPPPGPPTGGREKPGVATVILAVADGVGSVDGAAAASHAAVVAACDALARTLTTPTRARDAPGTPGASDGGPGGRGDGMWVAAFGAADAAVRAAGGATTLLVAVVDGDRRATVARLGDSVAFLLDDGAWTELGPAEGDGDDSLSTATPALPFGAGAAPAIEVIDVDLGSDGALMLMTDGVANPLRDGPTSVAPALAEALAEPPSPLALALLADFSRQGCHDDRTVLGLWPRPDDPH